MSVIDNESQKEIIRIKKLKEEDVKNTQDLIAWQNNAEKQLKELSKVVNSLNKDKERLEKKISVAEKKGGADSKEVKEMRGKLAKIEQTTKTTQRRIAGYKGQKALLEKQGIKSGMSVQQVESGESYVLDEESTKEYQRNKKRLEKNKIKNDLEETKLKDNSAKSYKKMNKEVSDVTRAFGIFKVALMGFALYQAISKTLQSGADATNTAVRSAMKADITAEHSMALKNVSKSLGLRDDFLLDIFVSSKNIKDRFAQIGGQLSEDEMKALGAAGINASSIQSMKSSDFAVKALQAIENVFSKGEIHKANRMMDLLFGGDAKMLLAAKQSNIIYKNMAIEDMIGKGINVSNMPAGFSADMAKYNKELAEFQSRLENITQAFWNLFQNGLTPILNWANKLLNIVSPDKETAQSDFKEKVKADDLESYRKYYGKYFGGGNLFSSIIGMTKDNSRKGERYNQHTDFVGGLTSMVNSSYFTKLSDDQKYDTLNTAYNALETYGVKNEDELRYILKAIENQSKDPEMQARLRNSVNGISGSQFLKAARDDSLPFDIRREFGIAVTKLISGLDVGGFTTTKATAGNQGYINPKVTIRLETTQAYREYEAGSGQNVTIHHNVGQ